MAQVKEDHLDMSLVGVKELGWNTVIGNASVKLVILRVCVRDAIYAKKVTKLWTLSLPPLAPLASMDTIGGVV